MSGTLRLKRKSLSLIFLVLSYTRRALSYFLRPLCSLSTFLVGAGIFLNVACPFISFYYFAFYAISASCLYLLLIVVFSRKSFGGSSIVSTLLLSSY